MFLYFASFLCQDPPLWLSVEKPSTSGIDFDEDGVWSIVGGKVRVVLLIVYAFDALLFIMSSSCFLIGILSEDFFLGCCFIQCYWTSCAQGCEGSFSCGFSKLLDLFSSRNFSDSTLSI